MSGIDDLIAEREALQIQEKELRQVFVAAAWDVVRADTEDALRRSVRKLRSLGRAAKSPEAHRKELDAEIAAFQTAQKAAKKARLQGNVPLEQQIAKDAEAKRRKQEADEANRQARIERGRLAKAKAEAYRAAADLAEMQRLAAEEKRSAIIAQALSTGSLREVAETRHQRLVNDQRRSGGGIVRVESGDGR